MGQNGGDRSVFAAAATGLADELRRMPGASHIRIQPGCFPTTRPPLFTRATLGDANSLIRDIGTWEATDWRLDLAGAMASAMPEFEAADRAKRLYILSDFRRADLIGEGRPAAIRRQFAELRKEGVEVIAMDYGRSARNNLSVQNLSLLDRFASTRAPLRLALTVRNNSPETANNVPVRIATRVESPAGPQDAEPMMLTIPDLPPGQSVAVEFSVAVPFAGSAAITASLPADELEGDNTAYLAVDVRPYVRVLVIDGEIDLSDPAESESFYFVRAIDPTGDGRYGAKPVVVSEDSLTGVNFEDYDLVVWTNVSRLPQDVDAASTSRPATSPASRYPMLASLEEFVRNGGGLAVFAGKRLDISFYNECLWQEGAGLIPLRIGAPRGKADPAGEFTRLNPEGIADNWFLETFQGDGRAFTGLIRFFAFMSAQEIPVLPAGDAGPPIILAKFSDAQHSPAIAARRFGKGVVVMFYTTAGARWTDWPTDPLGTYPKVMLDMVSIVSRARRQLTKQAGEPIVVEVPPQVEETYFRRLGPQQEELPLERVAPDRLVYGGPTAAGVYAARFRTVDRKDTETLFTRNIDPDEGDLVPGGRESLTAAFGRDDFVYRSMGHKAGDDDGKVGREDYWKYAIAALLVLLAAEVFLGQRFGHYSAPTRGAERG
jgi:hypothetical protein